MPKVVPLPKRKRGGYGLPFAVLASVALAAFAGYAVGRSHEHLVTLTEWMPFEVHDTVEKTVPYEVKVYYPIKAPTVEKGHTCPSIAEALNMFEFLALDRKPK
jgi:hypothetical protein